MSVGTLGIGDFVAINNFDDELETRGTSAAGIKHVENLPDYESAVNAYTDKENLNLSFILYPSVYLFTN